VGRPRGGRLELWRADSAGSEMCRRRFVAGWCLSGLVRGQLLDPPCAAALAPPLECSSQSHGCSSARGCERERPTTWLRSTKADGATTLVPGRRLAVTQRLSGVIRSVQLIGASLAPPFLPSTVCACQSHGETSL